MNIKEWIFPLSFAVIMTYALQIFFDPREKVLGESQLKSGAGFVAPTVQDVNKPLLLDINFKQDREEKAAELFAVTTPLATYVFSNKGAVLQAFSFPWQNGNQTINTMLADENCFLVALEKDTPLMYEMINVTGDDLSDRTIEYKAEIENGSITKIFTMHKDSYQVDLQILITSNADRTENPLYLRIFIAEPVMSPAIGWDKSIGLINNDSNNLTTIDLSKKDTLYRYWVMPTSFGYESRFIVHTMVQDADHFAQRAYMKKNVSGHMVGIVESRPVYESNQWKMAFYIGPKSAELMSKVDVRLLKTLNFGWLAPIAHPILSFLKYLYEKIGNYGWAIILLTLLMKLLLLPFTFYGEKNMRKGVDMQQKLAYLQKKYKNNPEMLDQERAELIKKHGMPGLTGCLPMLISLPILIALNTVLSNAIELYGAPFLWISNLYAVDPYYILPILTGLVMIAGPVQADPKQVVTRYGMALFMGAVMTNLSAGLVLFVFVNSAVSVLQTSLQKR